MIKIIAMLTPTLSRSPTQILTILEQGNLSKNRHRWLIRPKTKYSFGAYGKDSYGGEAGKISIGLENIPASIVVRTPNDLFYIEPNSGINSFQGRGTIEYKDSILALSSLELLSVTGIVIFNDKLTTPELARLSDIPVNRFNWELISNTKSKISIHESPTVQRISGSWRLKDDATLTVVVQEPPKTIYIRTIQGTYKITLQEGLNTFGDAGIVEYLSGGLVVSTTDELYIEGLALYNTLVDDKYDTIINKLPKNKFNETGLHEIGVGVDT